MEHIEKNYQNLQTSCIAVLAAVFKAGEKSCGL